MTLEIAQIKTAIYEASAALDKDAVSQTCQDDLRLLKLNQEIGRWTEEIDCCKDLMSLRGRFQEDIKASCKELTKKIATLLLTEPAGPKAPLSKEFVNNLVNLKIKTELLTHLGASPASLDYPPVALPEPERKESALQALTQPDLVKPLVVKATKTARLLAARDASCGVLGAYFKNLFGISVKALFLYAGSVFSSYLQHGVWSGTQASVEILILLFRKTGGAVIKSTCQLFGNLVRAGLGILWPRIWVSAVSVREDVTPSLIKNLAAAWWGVLCPSEGHVYGFQKEGEKCVVVEYTTRLERLSEEAYLFWNDFNEKADLIISSYAK